MAAVKSVSPVSSSVTFESLNIYENQSLLSKKGESLHLCIQEVQLINKTLNDKSEQLKQWQNELKYKEKTVIKLADSVNQYVEREVSEKSLKVVLETEKKSFQFQKKFDNLFKDYKRLLSSFESIKIQNKSLKTKLEEYQRKEESMNREKEKLIAKVTLSSTKTVRSSIKLRDMYTQTRFPTEDNNVSFSSDEKRLDPSLTFTTVLHQIWLQLLQTSLQHLFTVNPQQNNGSSQTFAEICLLVIPISIEYLRSNIHTSVDHISPMSIRKKHSDLLRYYIEMLYWSVVYMDISRIPLRPGIMSPLTRLGEELALIVVSKIPSSISLKNTFINDKQLLSVLLLLTIRCVNQMDLLVLVVNYLLDVVKRNQNMWGILLSNFLHVPLLCRWTSTSTCFASLYSKILHIVFDSLNQKVDYTQRQNSLLCINDISSKRFDLGLDQLILLIISIPIYISETNKTTNYHPLMFILDNLHTSKSSEKEIIISIIDQISKTKQVRQLSRELGIIGILSGLISQCGDSDDAQYYAVSVTKLKSVLACVTN